MRERLKVVGLHIRACDNVETIAVLEHRDKYQAVEFTCINAHILLGIITIDTTTSTVSSMPIRVGDGTIDP